MARAMTEPAPSVLLKATGIEPQAREGQHPPDRDLMRRGVLGKVSWACMAFPYCSCISGWWKTFST